MNRLDLDDELVEDFDDIEDIEADAAVSVAVRLAGTALAAAAYRIPGRFYLWLENDRVVGRAALQMPYAGRRRIKARALYMRLTAYAVTHLAGAEAMHSLLGHTTGCEHDSADAAAFISSRAGRPIRKAERERIILDELRPAAARLMKGRAEQLIQLATALVNNGLLDTTAVRRLIYPAAPKLH